MTYLDLIKRLNEIPAERLNDDVTVCHGDEYFAAKGHNLADKENDVLDEGHFFLEIN